MAIQLSSLKILGIELVLLLSDLCLSAAHYHNNLQLVAEWKEMEYKFPSKALRRDALRDGRYVHNNSIPLDVDVYYDEQKNPKIFVTIPKFENGVPVTLGYITKEQGKGGPKLQPYPDYTWHSSNGANCNFITSAVRVAIDKCNRLWVIDTGRNNQLETTQSCPPQLLAFDLKTDQLVHRYKIPESQYKPGVSYVATPIVDVRDSPEQNCENSMIYISDDAGSGLIVYDLSCGESWRFENKLMYPDPEFENFSISGQSFVLKAGIVGITVSPNCVPQSERLLYFHGLSSDAENTVPLRYLDDKKNWVPRPANHIYPFKKIGSRGSQSVPKVMDRYGNLFFGITSPNAIICWDSSTPYIKSNLIIIAKSKSKLQLVTGIKIVTNPYGKDELWLLPDRYQKFATRTLNADEVNFRILTIPMEKILHGTKCKGTSLA